MCQHYFFSGLLLSTVAVWASAQNQNTDFQTTSMTLSMQLFRTTLSADRTNSMISTASTSTVMAMMQQGSQQSTEDEIKTLMRADKDTNRDNYKIFTNDMQNNVDNSTLRFSSRSYANYGFGGSRAFENILYDNFNAQTRHIDFSQQGIATQILNSFICTTTNTEIQDTVLSDKLLNNAELILVNTIAMTNAWKMPFKTERTQLRNFDVAYAQSKQVPTMRIQKELKTGYLPATYASWLQLPLQNDRFYLLLVLPSDNTDLDTVVEGLQVQDVLDLVNQMDTKETQLVDVFFPKLNFKKNVNLTDVLTLLQLESLFNKTNANLCGISDNATYVADVTQNAVLQIDETGVKLAAATLATESKKNIGTICNQTQRLNDFADSILINVQTAVPDVTKFYANHPFLALVIDKQNKFPLFSARVFDPSQS